jgi:hypothetical protein
MKGNKGLFSIAFVLFVLLGWIPAIATEMAEQKAVEASNTWLVLTHISPFAMITTSFHI